VAGAGREKEIAAREVTSPKSVLSVHQRGENFSGDDMKEGESDC